jgi:hypothetical protein
VPGTTKKKFTRPVAEWFPLLSMEKAATTFVPGARSTTCRPITRASCLRPSASIYLIPNTVEAHIVTGVSAYIHDRIAHALPAFG